MVEGPGVKLDIYPRPGLVELLLGRGDGDTLATLTPPPRQYQTTVLGPHALSEAMGPSSTFVMRLIGPFHDEAPGDESMG